MVGEALPPLLPLMARHCPRRTNLMHNLNG